jgi:hypothetical protein
MRTDAGAFLKERDADKLAPFLFQAERFLLLVRSFAGTRSDVGLAEAYRQAHNILMHDEPLDRATWMLVNRVASHFSISGKTDSRIISAARS